MLRRFLLLEKLRRWTESALAAAIRGDVTRLRTLLEFEEDRYSLLVPLKSERVPSRGGSGYA